MIERDEARFHLGDTSSSDDEENGNEQRGNEDTNSFAGVRDDLNLPLLFMMQQAPYLLGANYFGSLSVFEVEQKMPSANCVVIPKDGQHGDIRRPRGGG